MRALIREPLIRAGVREEPAYADGSYTQTLLMRGLFSYAIHPRMWVPSLNLKEYWETRYKACKYRRRGRWLAVLLKLYSPLLEQQLDDLVVPVARSCLQRVAIIPALRVDVGPRLEQ